VRGSIDHGVVATAGQRTITINPDGSVAVSSAVVPLSALLTEGSRKVLMRTRPTEGPGAPVPVPAGISDMSEVRRVYNENLKPVVDHMREVFPVEIEETTIDGIPAAIITPKGGVPEEQKPPHSQWTGRRLPYRRARKRPVNQHSDCSHTRGEGGFDRLPAGTGVPIPGSQ
jgi:hypothetical protein